MSNTDKTPARFRARGSSPVIIVRSEAEDKVDPCQATPPDRLGRVEPLRALHVRAEVGEVAALQLDPERTDLEGEATPEHDRVLADIEPVMLVGLLALHETERVEAELVHHRRRIDEAQTRAGVTPQDLRSVPAHGEVAVDLGVDTEPRVIEVVAHLGVDRPHTRPGVTVPVTVPTTTPDQEAVPHQVVRVDRVAPKLDRDLSRVILSIEEETRRHLVTHEPVAIRTTVGRTTNATVEVGTTEIRDPELQVANRVDTPHVDGVDSVQLPEVEDLSPTLERQLDRVDQAVRSVPTVVVILRPRGHLRERGRHPEHREEKRDDEHDDEIRLHDCSPVWFPVDPPQALGRGSVAAYAAATHLTHNSLKRP